jgi:primary-amine oxidase
LPPYQYEACEECVLSDPGILKLFEAYNINPEHVIVECWATGHFSEQDDTNRRLTRPLLYLRSQEHPASNAYGRPLDQICPVVDMHQRKVVRIENSGKQHLPLAPAQDKHAEFRSEYIPDAKVRKSVKPLIIKQPQGPSFQVNDHIVSWQGWNFRIGFNQREGLTLHNILFAHPQTPDDVRPIMHRASFAEMIVPYGSPHAPNFRKNAFDAGEDGLGNSANSLRLGCDCLGDITYFDGNIMDSKGRVVVIKNAICLHEEDDGLLWKHVDWRTGHPESRRGRKLVVSFVATVANYDYAFYYNFYMDGQVKFLVKLTGILSTSLLAPADKNPKYGTRIAPALNAPIHQHFFVVRIDWAVDGAANRIEEVEIRQSPPGNSSNPHSNAFYAHSKIVQAECGCDFDNKAARHWRVSSSVRRNRLGRPTAYRVFPTVDVRPFARPESSVMQRASFLHHNVWFSATDPSQLFPSGRFPNQRGSSAGVSEWVRRQRNLVDTNVTMWYVFGITHVVRPEEWPVMCYEVIDFHVSPEGFFDCNPALDLPADFNAGVDDANALHHYSDDSETQCSSCEPRRSKL